MERYYIKGNAWAMVNEKTKDENFSNCGPWYHFQDVEALQKELAAVKEESCKGCKWFRFPACDYPDVCKRMETDHYAFSMFLKDTWTGSIIREGALMAGRGIQIAITYLKNLKRCKNSTGYCGKG